MGIFDYIARLFYKKISSARRRLEEEIELNILRINQKTIDINSVIYSFNPDIFEQELVFIKRDIAEYEEFSAKLYRAGLHQDANRLNRKINTLKIICDEAKEKYQE